MPKAPEGALGCHAPKAGSLDLISNATKFGAGAPIDVEVFDKEGEVCLIVGDRGPGIADHEREKIFKRFERAGSSPPQSGFGVGLWLVRQIVDALGGTVHVNSALGQGATFTIALPRNYNA